MISYNQLLEWKEHPVTLKLIKLIKEAREYQSESLAKGCTLGEFVEQNTARAVGYIRALDMVLEADLKEEETLNE